MGVESTFLEQADRPSADLAEVADNTAFAYLAVASCVFFILRVPESLPIEIERTLIPPQLLTHGSRQIWPNPRSQYFPLDVMPDQDFDKLLGFPRATAEAIALPVIGLTESERRE